MPAGTLVYAGLMILTMAGLLEAQDGAALYKERCASCHDSPVGRIPSRIPTIDAIKQMTGEAIYAALTTGAVKMARGQPAVAGGRVFIGTLAGDVYSIDATSGCVHWAFKATAGIRSGVTVGDANGVPAIFFGDRSAVMYALNSESGELLWKA